MIRLYKVRNMWNNPVSYLGIWGGQKGRVNTIGKKVHGDVNVFQL